MGTDVAVFGGSDACPGDDAYETARKVGGLLAAAGFGVVSGGYGGIMEAASRGAREAGGVATGIRTREFEFRGPVNPWLSRTIVAENLFERTRFLMEMSAAYIILPGKAGTLAELAFLWALNRGGLLKGKPVVLLGGFWDGLVEHLVARRALDLSDARATSIASTPEEAVDIIRNIVSPT